jgi:hypothetical protein
MMTLANITVCMSSAIKFNLQSDLKDKSGINPFHIRTLFYVKSIMILHHCQHFRRLLT